MTYTFNRFHCVLTERVLLIIITTRDESVAGTMYGFNRFHCVLTECSSLINTQQPGMKV